MSESLHAEALMPSVHVSPQTEELAGTLRERHGWNESFEDAKSLARRALKSRPGVSDGEIIEYAQHIWFVAMEQEMKSYGWRRV